MDGGSIIFSYLDIDVCLAACPSIHETDRVDFQPLTVARLYRKSPNSTRVAGSNVWAGLSIIKLIFRPEGPE